MGVDQFRRHSLISFTSTIGFTAIGLIATMYFAHILGTAAYGVYALFIAYFSIFNLIGDGGFGVAAVKRISEGRDQNAYFSAFVFLRIILLAASVSVVLALSSYLNAEGLASLVPWLIFALIVGVFLSISVNGVYGEGMVGVSQTSHLINNVIKVIVQIIAVFLGYSTWGLVGGFITGMIFGALISLRYLHLSLTRFSTFHLRNLLTFSFWIFLSTSGALIFSYADTILVGYFMSTADAGIYRITFQFTAAATFTTIALQTTLYPKISRWHAEGLFDLIRISLSRAFTYSLLLAVPVAVGGWILGDRLLYFLYGASFAAGAQALSVLLLVQIVNVFMYLQTMALNAIDRPRHSFYATGTAAMVNVILDLALIPLLGILGAAVATLITMVVNAIIARYYLSKQILVRLERSPSIHILLAAGSMGAIVLLCRLTIQLSNFFIVLSIVILGAIVYTLLLLKADRGIRDEIRELVMQLGFPWPGWL